MGILARIAGRARKGFPALKVIIRAVTDNTPLVYQPAETVETPQGTLVTKPEVLQPQGGLQSGTIRAQIGIITTAVTAIGVAWAAGDYIFVAGGVVTIILALRAIYRHAISWAPVNQMAAPMPTP